MTRIEFLKENIEERGNVMHCNDFDRSDFDAILKRLDRQGKYTENMIFASPWFFQKLKDITDGYISDAKDKGFSYGSFQMQKDSKSPLWYLVDMSLRRGTYEFHVIVKPIEETYIIPVEPHNDAALYRNSVLIYQDKD